MKNLHKIIVLFAVIFFSGIAVTVFTIKSSLNKTETPTKASEIQKDTTYLLKVEKKVETV